MTCSNMARALSIRSGKGGNGDGGLRPAVAGCDHAAGPFAADMGEPSLDVGLREHRGVELVLTGRRAPQTILDRADLVTEMREVKHYYAQGVLARKGIEY